MRNERKCCPFLTFRIEVPAGGEPVWLRVTGPEGTAAFLEHELSLGRSAGQPGVEVDPTF